MTSIAYSSNISTTFYTIYWVHLIPTIPSITTTLTHRYYRKLSMQLYRCFLHTEKWHMLQVCIPVKQCPFLSQSSYRLLWFSLFIVKCICYIVYVGKCQNKRYVWYELSSIKDLNCLWLFFSLLFSFSTGFNFCFFCLFFLCLLIFFTK